MNTVKYNDIEIYYCGLCNSIPGYAISQRGDYNTRYGFFREASIHCHNCGIEVKRDNFDQASDTWNRLMWNYVNSMRT